MAVILISGTSCSGKSTLAARLQRRLRWPLFAKDTIKESLFDSLGIGDAAWSRRLSDAAYDLLFQQTEQCLRAEQSCLVEANFRDAHEPRLQQLLLLAAGCGLQVHCRAQADVLVARFLRRQRHPGHLDHLNHAHADILFASAPQRPLCIPAQLIECDTTLDLPSAMDAACAAVERALAQLRAPK